MRSTGTLSANDPPRVRVSEGAGPRHFAFHPNNRNLYLLNELDGSLYTYAYDAASGTLSEQHVDSALPSGFDGPPFGEKGPSRNGGPKGGRHPHQPGRPLPLRLRAHHQHARRLRGRPRERPPDEDRQLPDREDAAGLQHRPQRPLPVVAGQDSNTLAVNAIDQQSGRLTFLKQYPMGEGPNWVEILRLS